MNEFYNGEGYPDPVPFEAVFKRPDKAFRPMVCIAAYPSSSPMKEKEDLEAACRMAVDKGCIPLSPRLALQDFMEKGDDYEFFSLVYLTKCRELWVAGNGDDRYVSSLIKAARTRGLPVRKYTEKDLDYYR